MKKTLVCILVLTLLTFTGCQEGQNEKNWSNNEKNAAVVTVEKYLDSTCAGRWQDVIPLISGEHLREVQSKMQFIKHKESIVNKNIYPTFQTDQLTEVYADVTKKTPLGYDRVAYNFNLYKTNGIWKIYNAQVDEFKRPELEPGELDAAVKEVIKNYFKLNTTEKRKQDYKYLAGKLLKISQSAKQVNGSKPIVESSQKVINIKPMGVSDQYVIASVLYEDSEVPAQAIIDLVKVSDKWKIVRMDIAQINK